jgi:hypothetical protein
VNIFHGCDLNGRYSRIEGSSCSARSIEIRIPHGQLHLNYWHTWPNVPSMVRQHDVLPTIHGHCHFYMSKKVYQLQFKIKKIRNF